MKVQYEFSLSELKALLELIQELCRRTALDETLSRSILKKLNEKHFK